MTTRSECKIRLLDEVSAMVVGLHGDHLEMFYNKYSVHAPNYFFNPRYKLGQWDGKTHFFSDRGKTYVYLLDDLLPRIVKLGYKIVIEDLRTTSPVSPEQIDEASYSHIIHAETGEPTMMRDYQVNGVNELIKNGYGILKACTGAGKTLICTALCDAYGKLGIKTITIVPNQDLIRNTKKDYIAYGLDVGEYSGTSKDIDHQHVVSTWQALKNNPKMMEEFQMILVDECHGAKGKVLQNILVSHSSNILYRFGVTGTLPKDENDLMLVHVALGPVRATVEAVELQDRGVLAQMQINVLQLEEDLLDEYNKFCREDFPGSKPPTYTQFKDGYFPDFTSEKSFLHRNDLRIEWIASYILAKQDKKKGNVLCLVDSIALGRQLAELIPGSIFVNGVDVKKSSKRQEIYDLFRTRDDLVVFATVHIAGTGLNIPRINHLMFVDIGKSFIRIIQGIGRGLRIAHDKDSVEVDDICSDLKYSKRHLKQRTNYYEEAKYKFKKHKIDYAKMMAIDDGV